MSLLCIYMVGTTVSTDFELSVCNRPQNDKKGGQSRGFITQPTYTQQVQLSFGSAFEW